MWGGAGGCWGRSKKKYTAEFASPPKPTGTINLNSILRNVLGQNKMVKVITERTFKFPGTELSKKSQALCLLGAER